MNQNTAGDAAIRENAARWVVRQDRQLTTAEIAELEQWLAADARHADAFKRSTASWQICRNVVAAVRRTPVEPAKPRAALNWAGLGSLAAAAALVLAFLLHERTPQSLDVTVAAPTAPAASAATRWLPDGSVALLKGDAEIAESFTPAERRIRLIRGEAFFTVTKDAARPFFVVAGNTTVRAVGTAFAVRYEPNAVEVLVTEGTVSVTPPTKTPDSRDVPEPAPPALVNAGYRARVAHVLQAQEPSVAVNAVSPDEMAQSLAWNESMLDLGNAPLGELVAKFAARSGRNIEIADPVLAAVRIGGRFPTDDVDGFIRALEEIYKVKSERRADGTILLRKAR